MLARHLEGPADERAHVRPPAGSSPVMSCQLPLLTDSIVGIELPTIEGFGLTDVIVEPVGPDDGYLSLHGDLFEE